MSHETIDKLMRQARMGDRDAFGQLALLVQDALYRFALSQGLSRCMAAEATQETLLRAFKLRRRWRDGGRAMSWLYGIAMNVAREHRRRQLRAGLGLDAAAISLEAAPADAQAQQAENLAALTRAIEQLPDRQREAVTCRHLRQMSVRQTAEVMGCAEGTIKAATAAGMQKLKEALGDQI